MAERARKRAKHGDAVNGANGANGVADYTAAEALLEALVDADVTHLFVNLGSDHPALLEAMSKRKREGKEKLKIITAPNEFVGLCACQGFFQASGKMQAILVHVDAGTLAMAGAIHNAARARIPVVMIAGTSPVTEEGEMAGSRNVRSPDSLAYCSI
jgi:acetolactate synthase-1/2/3 large subunit